MALQNILIQQWYEPKLWGWLLWPASKIFQCIVWIRKSLYQVGIFKSFKANVPVVVVGNLTVGGTGKTPLVIALCELLKHQGLRPGIVLRGYKSRARGVINVVPNMDPGLVGDEALVLARRCNCPVAIAKKRVRGVQNLIVNHGVDIILCDDGLQHYALQRDLEIVVVDAERGFGNGQFLPMGPLRETPKRLGCVDMTITNGRDMQVICEQAYSLLNRNIVTDIKHFSGQTVHAIAGIGAPHKFFNMLRQQGINVIAHEFSDHHDFKMQDLNFSDQLPILMTEKDAVKCGAFASNRHWVVPVNAKLLPEVLQSMVQLIQGVLHGR